MQLVVGTYERFLLGYRLPGTLEEDCQLKRSFTHAAHQGPVRCLDAAGPWVVSGGQDDQLHLYDLQHNKDLGFVMNPGEGAIPCVSLFTPRGAARPTHLFSGSDDGSIAIWAAGGGWQLLKLMRGHKGPLRGISIHPSGRLALSVGHDRALRMWNLAKGRCSYTAKLEHEADAIAFSSSGEEYALTCDKLVSLHAVAQEGRLLARLQHSRRAVSLLQQEDGAAVLTGQEDGRLLLWDVRAGGTAAVVAEALAHRGRIRAITAVSPAAGGAGLPLHIASASSDGVVKLWDMRRFGSSSSSHADGSTAAAAGGPCELASVATQGRITGMVLSAPDRPAAGAAADAAGEGIGAGGAAVDAAELQQQKAAAKKQRRKQQRKQQQQQEQHNMDADDSDAEQTEQGSAASHQQKQQQKRRPPQQQEQQQQQVQRVQQRVQQQQKQHLKKKKKQLLKQAAGGAGGGDDTALVPRVTTKIAKKKVKPSKQQMQAAVAAAVGGGSGSGGGKAGGAKKRQQLLQQKTAGARVKQQLDKK